MAPVTTLLLDRDGTLIRDKRYLADPAGVELLPHVAEALGILARQGMRFFMVSNQSGIGRGLFTAAEAEACNARLADLLRPSGVEFAEMIYCPHDPAEDCPCRKPAVGMWESLRQRHGLDPKSCAMVGDKLADMAFASRAGMAAGILALTGDGAAEARRLGISMPVSARMILMGRSQGPEWPQAVIGDFGGLLQALAVIAAIKG